MRLMMPLDRWSGLIMGLWLTLPPLDLETNKSVKGLVNPSHFSNQISWLFFWNWLLYLSGRSYAVLSSTTACPSQRRRGGLIGFSIRSLMGFFPCNTGVSSSDISPKRRIIKIKT